MVYVYGYLQKYPNFSPPPGFELKSPGTESQCATKELFWIMNFHLAIQMPDNSLLFKPLVMQPISQTTYDLNSELLVC